MKTEVYRGRNLKVRAGRKSDWGYVLVTVNEQTWRQRGTDESKAMEHLRSNIDFIGEDVDGDRWAAYWYAPGTYRMCSEGLHPVALDGECRHSTCVEKHQ